MSHLQHLLNELRAYADEQRFSKRDDKGRFSASGREYTGARKLPRTASKNPLRMTKRDSVIGRDVESAEGQAHQSHPVVPGLHGENVEKAMHELLEGNSATGFSILHTGGSHTAAHRLATTAGALGLTYAYYAGGNRHQNGRKNRDHIPDLRDMLGKTMRGKVRVEVSKGVGHVKNGGWPSEDHMETVHYNDGRKPDSGVERSAQHVLTVVPHESITDPAERKAVVKEAAARIDKHAADTGYRWDVPDMKIYGAEPPDTENWVNLPQMVVNAPKGIYSVLHTPVVDKSPVPRKKKDGMKFTDPGEHEKLLTAMNGTTRHVWLPKEWSGFIEPLHATAVHKAVDALHSGV